MSAANIQCRQVLASLRGIISRIDMESIDLARNAGFTEAQFVILKELDRAGEISIRELSANVGMKYNTVNLILNQLDRLQLKLISTKRNSVDARVDLVSITEYGRRVLKNNPVTTLEERFERHFKKLPEIERRAILDALGKIAFIMKVRSVPQPPLLVSGPVTATMRETVDFLTASRFYEACDI